MTRFFSTRSVGPFTRPMSTTRTHPAVTSAEFDKSLVVVVGGLNVKDGQPLAMAQQFDASSRKWSPLPDFPYPIFSASAVSDNEQVYVVGGKCGKTGKTTSALQVLDLKAGKPMWESLAPLALEC